MTARLIERHPRRCPQGAFTLVEMLIAMALTLIMVGAIAEFYAYVGETVKDGRAMIEINGLMRAAIQRLKSDLDSVTAQAIPWADDGSGYIEIYEGPAALASSGPASDGDANGNYFLDVNEDIRENSGSGDGQNDVLEYGGTNLFGDGDDVIAMTIRANGEPLSGRYVLNYGSVTPPPAATTISAQHAEVVWWVGFNDVNASGVWDWNEPRQIYRRQLLIRPDYLQIGSDVPAGATNQAPQQNAWTTAKNYLLTWWQTNDVSASVRLETDSTGANWVFRIRANSLADLSRREYRFGHWLYDNRPYAGSWGENYPYPCALLPSPSANSPSPSPYVLKGAALGEDVVLSNVLAFDVRVYDPYAVIKGDKATAATSDVALAPGDPGYLDAVKAGYANLGTGAFVDLGYGETLARMLAKPAYNVAYSSNFAASSFGKSYFSGTNNYYAANNVSLLGTTWDSWTWWYERDGIDNDFDGTTDLATNGLDDLVKDPANPAGPKIYMNGVDDAGEREANPPYARALRGLEVKIRLYEPGTRQVRQATVGTDFVAE